MSWAPWSPRRHGRFELVSGLEMLGLGISPRHAYALRQPNLDAYYIDRRLLLRKRRAAARAQRRIHPQVWVNTKYLRKE